MTAQYDAPYSSGRDAAYDECDRLSQYTNPADDRLTIPKEGEPCL